MTLDLVGKLHRTVYVDGCPSTFYEDFVRLLVLKCGPIEGWDVADRLIVVFRTLNSVSTALSFSGTAFGDLNSHVVVWVANQPPPPSVAQQAAITAGSGGKTADEARAALEAREKRLAKIREELAEDIARDREEENIVVKTRQLCLRQLRALCTLTAHAIKDVERSLEESTSHLNSMKELVRKLSSGNGKQLSYDSSVKQLVSPSTSSAEHCCRDRSKSDVVALDTDTAATADVPRGCKRPR